MKTIYLALLIMLIVGMLAGCSGPSPVPENPIGSASNVKANSIIGEVENTDLSLPGEIDIRGIGRFDFTPGRIESVRKDIFREGHFSLFDVLVHLDARGDIDMKYHFDQQMNTHVIDSINRKENWWYFAYYHGGWSENNVFRMDHFPYKDRMTIRITQANREYLEEVFKNFREEVRQKKKNNGRIIIPEVLIKGPNTRITLENVAVRPHNLRSDVFQEGVITAIDVVMTLGERGELTYDLKWYERIGSSIVRNYFVERINDDAAYGRCGFVYEAGPQRFGGFRGNHIHLPSDTRVINSPQYLEYFWICL